MGSIQKSKLVLVSIILLLTAVSLMTLWLDHFSRTSIQVQAEASATNWIDGFEKTVPQLDAIVAGAPVTPQQRQFIEATMVGSAVFEVQIFDAAGNKLFDSAVSGNGIPAEREHYVTAEQVALTGITELFVEAGDQSIGEPATFVEAYMPFYGGNVQPIGVVELYVDASAAAAALASKFGWVSLIAIAATVVVFVAPGVALVRQNDALRQRDEKLSAMSRTDSLTGLLNRRDVNQALTELAARIEPDETVWMLQIDLDKFKPINDVFGHHVGDQLLTELAARLRTAAQPDAIVARTGGDEFFISYASRMPSTQVLAEAEYVRQSLSKTVQVGGDCCQVGASIGISAWTKSSPCDVIEAIRQADFALNVAKESNGSKVLIFETSMQAQSQEEARVAREVTQGLQNDQFTAHFQPIVDAKSEQIIGFEALVRWCHPELGILAPNAFLSASDKAGLTTAIDKVVLRDAISFAKMLKENGLSDLQVSINLTDVKLKKKNIVDEFLWELEASEIAPEQFRIELSEATLLDDRASYIAENVQQFHKSGFSIDLDDFGTGHTAISSLHLFPVDRIKIDRSLIVGLAADAQLATLTGILATLGEKLNIDVVAEGVETAADLQVLRRLNINAAQGFLFAKPMPADACLAAVLGQRSSLSA